MAIKRIDIEKWTRTLQAREEDKERTTQKWLQYPKGSKEYCGFALNVAKLEYEIGRLQYFLLENEDYSKSFNNAAVQFRLFNSVYPWGTIFYSIQGVFSLNWMRAAIFSKRHENCIHWAEDTLRSAPPPKEDGMKSPYFETMTMCHYFLEHYDETEKYCAMLRSEEEREKKDTDIHGKKWVGTDELILGLVKKDKEIIIKAIKSHILAVWSVIRKDDVPHPVITLSYLFLAKERGIDIKKGDIPEKCRLLLDRYFKDGG